jgi:myosin heavy chain 9/10/11/14
VLRVVSAVLLLGNIEFKQDKNSDQATLPDDTGLYFII